MDVRWEIERAPVPYLVGVVRDVRVVRDELRVVEVFEDRMVSS